MVHRMRAMMTSPAAAKMLIDSERAYMLNEPQRTMDRGEGRTAHTLISVSWAKVSNFKALAEYAIETATI